jgi:hypothetical protein
MEKSQLSSKKVNKVFYLKKERPGKEIGLYDLEIENNHNFFANHTLVHNCEHGRGKTFLDDLLPVKKSLYKDKYKKILKKIERAKNV